jgi:DNA-binding MarR family transcriptional regulator
MYDSLRNQLGLGFMLGALHRKVRSHWSTELRDLGLTPPAALIVRALAIAPGVSLRELARITESEPINLSRILEPLVSEGYIVVTTNPNDRRAHCYTLSETGCELAHKIDEKVLRFEMWMEKLVSNEELASLRKSVRLLMQALEDSQ